MALALVVGFADSAAAASRSQFRFLSFAIRDQAPSVEEAQAFRGGKVDLDQLAATWLDSDAHQNRIRRYFRDMFGVRDDLMMVDMAFVLAEDKADGHLVRAQDRAPCTPAQTVPSEAWWLEPGQTVNVCPNVISDSLTFEAGGGERKACTSDRAWQAGCGCGPRLIACIPASLDDRLSEDVREEFPMRAARAYQADAPWPTVFGGTEFFGSRLLYWKYLHSGGMARGGVLPADAELATLATLPVRGWLPAPLPQGELRAGLVTTAGFMMQHNNYRTRIRALSERLLCKAIGPELNTDGIAQFLNPDFEVKDLAHADQEQCARCHYPMDNLGSTLFGWNTRGEWDPTGREPSQIGHAFGVGGTGPRFLITSFIERGPDFVSCMARSAWEEFSGSKWDDLTDSERQSLEYLAVGGPRDLIRTMLGSTLLANLGVDATPVAAAAKPAIAWEQVAPAFAASCAGNSCHSSGSFNTTYVDHPKNVLEHAAAIATRIKATDGLMMPPQNGDLTLSEAHRALIMSFVGGTP